MNKTTVTLAKDCKIAGKQYRSGDKVEVTIRVAEILEQRKLISK